MSEITITKEFLDKYLMNLGKTFKKLNGKNMKAEIILVGGASIIINYNFRKSTRDIDAIILASSAMKEAINIVRDENELPNGWLNSDFMQTSSYSEKLREVSKYYKTFSNILEVRTVPAEYLIAMKLSSGRRYKNDLSDIVGILDEHKKKECPITLEEIIYAIEVLYDDSEKISKMALDFINNVFNYTNLEELYKQTCNEEEISKTALVEFEQEYPKSLNLNNIDEILAMLKKK